MFLLDLELYLVLDNNQSLPENKLNPNTFIQVYVPCQESELSDHVHVW
jgi:hypothetical protein